MSTAYFVCGEERKNNNMLNNYKIPFFMSPALISLPLLYNPGETQEGEQLCLNVHAFKLIYNFHSFSSEQ